MSLGSTIYMDKNNIHLQMINALNPCVPSYTRDYISSTLGRLILNTNYDDNCDNNYANNLKKLIYFEENLMHIDSSKYVNTYIFKLKYSNELRQCNNFIEYIFDNLNEIKSKNLTCLLISILRSSACIKHKIEVYNDIVDFTELYIKTFTSLNPNTEMYGLIPSNKGKSL